jgi:2-iminobutanoate/2-iminopropanoate deaminase
LPKKIVTSSQAPQPIGPYSQAVVSGGLLFASGQIPIDPGTGKIVGEDAVAQTEQVMKNLVAVLTEAKVSLEQVVKTTVYLADMADFASMNEVYGRYFSTAPPARSTIQAAALPKSVRVEIDVVAAF